jgi:hypothetical protein
VCGWRKKERHKGGGKKERKNINKDRNEKTFASSSPSSSLRLSIIVAADKSH